MAMTYSLRQVVAGHLIDGKYEIIRKLGGGGMSDVFLAKQLALDRQVAIKFIRPELLKGHDEHKFPERFKREGKAMARIVHPNCIQIYDLGELGDTTQFMVMEYFRGETIADLLDKDTEGIEQTRMVELAVQVTRALVAVHEASVTHYDLKPENLLVGRGPSGEVLVKLLDFGIAKIRSGDESAPAGAAGSLRVVPNPQPRPLTVELAVLGTPEFMSPEAASGKRVSAHADLYSLGVMFFLMLTGELPFRASEESQGEGPQVAAINVMVQHVASPPPFVSDVKSGVDSELVALVHKLMSKTPNERPSAAELLEQLERIERRLRQPKNAPVVERVKGATMALVGGVRELDRELKRKAIEHRIVSSDTGAPEQVARSDTMASPSLMERWGPWVIERTKTFYRRARIPVAATAVFIVAILVGVSFRRPDIVPATAVENQPTEPTPERKMPTAAVPQPRPEPVPATSSPIPPRDIDNALAAQDRRGFEANAPPYNPPPEVAVVVEVIEPKVPTPKPKPVVKANAAQLFQQASSAFAAGNTKKACSLARRAIAAADTAKANALRRAASRFECGPL